MAGGLLSGVADQALQRALDGTVLRHQAIAENMANVDTPGYKRLEVEFAAALKSALAQGESSGVSLSRTDPRHLAGGEPGLADFRPSAVRVDDTTGRPDGNNVDLDGEMSRLAENTLLYESLTQVLGRRVAMLRFAVNEGRR